MNNIIDNVTYVPNEKLIPKVRKLDNQLFNKQSNDVNSSIAIYKEYKCLIIENLTKLTDPEEYQKIKSVFIFIYFIYLF